MLGGKRTAFDRTVSLQPQGLHVHWHWVDGVLEPRPCLFQVIQMIVLLHLRLHQLDATGIGFRLQYVQNMAKNYNLKIFDLTITA